MENQISDRPSMNGFMAHSTQQSEMVNGKYGEL